MPDGCGQQTYMGVDVGLKLHAVIRQPLDEKRTRSRAVFIGEVDSFVELCPLIQRYRVYTAVVDTHPEQHQAV